MATADALIEGDWKTLFVYRLETGLVIKRVNMRNGAEQEFPVSSDEIEGMCRAWPGLKERLSNAGVQSVDRSTLYPKVVKASRAPDN